MPATLHNWPAIEARRRTILERESFDAARWQTMAHEMARPIAVRVLAACADNAASVPADAQLLLADLRIRIATRQPLSQTLGTLIGFVPWAFPAAA